MKYDCPSSGANARRPSKSRFLRVIGLIGPVVGTELVFWGKTPASCEGGCKQETPDPSDRGSCEQFSLRSERSLPTAVRRGRSAGGASSAAGVLGSEVLLQLGEVGGEGGLVVGDRLGIGRQLGLCGGNGLVAEDQVVDGLLVFLKRGLFRGDVLLKL